MATKGFTPDSEFPRYLQYEARHCIVTETIVAFLNAFILRNEEVEAVRQSNFVNKSISS